MLFILLHIEECTSYMLEVSFLIYFRPLLRQESTKLPTKKSVSPVQNHSPTGVTAHQIHSFFHATSAPRTFPGQLAG